MPSHLPAMVGSKWINPVKLPAGRARLTTRPLPIGSTTFTNTTGMVMVSRFNARQAVVV
jgi:hypothetical protein